MLNVADSKLQTKHLLIFLSLALIIISPLVVHASILFATQDETPLKLMVGSDYQTALQKGYISASLPQGSNDINLNIHGIAGATLVVDDLFIIKNESPVSNLQIRVLSQASGNLPVTTLELRFYTGSAPPISDTSFGVLGVLYIANDGTPISTGSSLQISQPFNGSNDMIHIQLVFLPSGQSSGEESMQAQVEILAE